MRNPTPSPCDPKPVKQGVLSRYQLTRAGGAPQWTAPVDALPEHRRLRRGQPHGAVSSSGQREAPPFQDLLVETAPWPSR